MNTTKTSNGEPTLNVESFNLVDRPWIPVVDVSGNATTVGLRELFERAEELADLATGTLETIAVFRLLFCIAQRALGDLEDEDAWREARKRLTGATVDYLEKWKSRFDLFDKEYPFLQIASLKPNKKSDVADLNKTDKLDFGLAVGNASTVFDQNAAAKGRIHTPEWLAIKLLVFQCFSPGGTIGSSNLEYLTDNQPGHSSNAPCAECNMLSTILKGENLAQTICWNLLTKEQIGTNLDDDLDIDNKPVWECDVINNKRERESLKYSFLGRLVPLARFIKLVNCQNMVLSGGIVYEKLPKYREPMGTIVPKSDGKGYVYLSTDPERSPWRNLNALLTWKQAEGDSRRGAVALNNLVSSRENNSNDLFSIWIGGIATDNAKIIDSANWTVQVRFELLGQAALNLYEDGVQLANVAQQRLVDAVKAYDKNLSLESQNQYDKKSSNVARAKRFFWSALERSQEALQECAVNGNLDDWRKVLKKEKIAAYERVCSRLTPRQLQAFAEGKKQLFFVPQEKNKKKDGVKKGAKKGKEKQ